MSNRDMRPSRSRRTRQAESVSLLGQVLQIFGLCGVYLLALTALGYTAITHDREPAPREEQRVWSLDDGNAEGVEARSSRRPGNGLILGTGDAKTAAHPRDEINGDVPRR